MVVPPPPQSELLGSCRQLGMLLLTAKKRRMGKEGSGVATDDKRRSEFLASLLALHGASVEIELLKRLAPHCPQLHSKKKEDLERALYTDVNAVLDAAAMVLTNAGPFESGSW